jgi:hypothetical protein
MPGEEVWNATGEQLTLPDYGSGFTLELMEDGRLVLESGDEYLRALTVEDEDRLLALLEGRRRRRHEVRVDPLTEEPIPVDTIAYWRERLSHSKWLDEIR